jgi:steroid delta-isomerase-like uncharacterized protein
MSVEENKAIAHLFFDTVWNKGDESVVDVYLAPDYVEHSPGWEPGREGYKKTAQQYRNAFPDINVTIEDEIAAEDRVVHRWTWRCTFKGPLFGFQPTGNKVEFTGITIVRLANGQIAERWANVDELTLLQQIGALPPVGAPARLI